MRLLPTLGASNAVTVGADDVALRHLGFDLAPGSPVGNERRDAAEFDPLYVVPIEAARPPSPATVGAASAEFDDVVSVLEVKPPPP
jgi:hypothetical protein